MILHLVRHGHYALAGQALGGRTDHPLDARGEAEAKALARELAAVGAMALHSSPRPRAAATAAAIAAVVGLPVRIDEALEEIEYGAWTARAFAALAPDPTWVAWNERRSTGRPPGGESTAELQARMRGWLADLDGASSVVAVGHCDPFRTLICELIGLSVDRIHALELAPAGRAVLEIEGNSGRLLALYPPPPIA